MVVSRIAEKNGRRYLEHNGNPKLFYGIQLRLDDAKRVGANEQDIEEYFSLSSKYGFPIVAVPVYWGEHIEPYVKSEEISGFVKSTIHYAEKYDLSVQWLWFGSNVCGVNAVPGCVPKEIWDNINEYPHNTVEGRECIDILNPAFIRREQQAIRAFMNMLLKADVNFRTSAVQIENEPDMNGFNNLTNRNNNLKLIDILGKTVKESNFSVLTRVNTTAQKKYMGEDSLLDDILALDGIDAVGVDVYEKNRQFFSDYADYLTAMPGNLPHFAEMGPHVAPIPQIICDALSKGCGALIYELKTVGDRNYDFGIFRADDKKWIERDGTKPVQHQWTFGEMTEESNTADIGVLNRMIAVVNEQLAITSVDNIQMILKGERKSVGRYMVEFNTDESGYNAFAMTVAAEDGHLYCFSLAQAGKFIISDTKSILRAEIYENDKWKPYDKTGGVFNSEKGCVYRIISA